MASVDPLAKALLAEAHETADQIILNARKKVRDTLNEQEKKGGDKAKEMVKLIEANAQKKVTINKQRYAASAELKAEWSILEKEHEMVDKVLSRVNTELHNLMKEKPDDYLHVLESLIVEGGIILGVSDLEVILNERDSNLPLDLGKLGLKIGEKTGLKITIIKSAKKIDAMGGAVIQTLDGKIVVNHTFEGMLSTSKNEIRYKIAQILFK
jgi:vacuolar-type H+-ATPase subunit E/Vma4